MYLLNCLKIKIDITATFIKSYPFCPTMSHYVSVDFGGVVVVGGVCVFCGQRQELEESGIREIPRGVYKLKGKEIYQLTKVR